MVKPFLRSGSLDDVLALGENGQPVYACAQQLRETLRLRRQQQAADCLAIPNRTKAAPASTGMRPSPARSPHGWRQAMPSARRQCATGTLPDDLSQPDGTGPATDHPSHRLFGALLAKAMHMPDPNHVYLVDDRPVLTFWGFIKPQAQSRTIRWPACARSKQR